MHPSGHESRVPVQTPELQSSECVQAFSSLQLVPSVSREQLRVSVEDVLSLQVPPAQRSSVHVLSCVPDSSHVES